MDGFINSSIEKQTIYEIYRACRLCGAGAGYKMPIMQNVVHLDGAEVELRQKIRECVQVEVHQEDKMPPLICELCVDKVNDFYEFLEMCRQTNKRTRLRLGLPAQTVSRGTSDAGDCILGVTEPVYLNEDSNDSLLKPRGRNKGKVTKESKSTKKTKSKQNEVRNLRSKHVSPLPQRAAKRSREEDMSLSMLKKTSTRQSTASPKSILRKEKEVKTEEEWSPTRSKRSRDSRDSKPDTVKKVKIVEKPVPSKPSSKSDFKCKTCKAQFNTNKALNNHARTHNKPQSKYRSTLKQEKKNSCSTCKKDFPTKLSLDRHKCAKNNTNKCGNCGRYIPNARNLTKHEAACRPKKELKISPKLLKQLRPLQIRVKRCDPLLKSVGERYDVAGVDCYYGLDKNCIYPYLRTLRIKTEPSYMVNIHDTIDDFDLHQDYVHWDSDSSESDSEMSDLREKSVGTLANLSLKTIFSHRFLGKVPKRKRRVKPDKGYDSILNFGSDVRLGIDNIINSLDNDKLGNDTKDNDNDSLFGEDKTPAVSNDDFDSLFNTNNDTESNINDKRKSDEGKCEISDKNNDKDTEKSENKINNDSTTELDSNDNDTIKNSQENNESESSEVVSDNVNIPDVNKDRALSSAEDSTNKESEHTEDNDEVSKNNDINDKVGNKDEDLNNSINNEKTSQIENNDSVFDNKSETVKNNDNGESNIVNDKDVSIDKERDVSIDKERDVSIDKERDVSIDKERDVSIDNDKDNGVHINGDDKLDFDDLEDISDSEMDDSRLMDAINEQIGEKETGDKSQDNDRDSVSVVKSTDLESISSEELMN